MTALLDEVLEAHGGLERWREARTVQARVRVGGLLIRTRVPGNRLADSHLTVHVQEPQTFLDPFPRDGQRGVFERGAARIEVATARSSARAHTPGPRSSDARACAETFAGIRWTPSTSPATRCGTTSRPRTS
jgi:hypothetical protein